jgi:hypothetical protein
MATTMYDLKNAAILRMFNEPALRAEYPRLAERARQYAYGAVSDSYKEAHGVRARWMSEASMDDLLDMLKSLNEEIAEQNQREFEEEQHEKEVTHDALTRVEFTMAPAFAAL